MGVYADSSFILRLVAMEAGSEDTIAAYRRLNYPPLFFLPPHALEIRNAILQRAFYQRHSVPSDERRHVARERDAALAQLEHYLSQSNRSG